MPARCVNIRLTPCVTHLCPEQTVTGKWFRGSLASPGDQGMCVAARGPPVEVTTTQTVSPPQSHAAPDSRPVSTVSDVWLDAMLSGQRDEPDSSGGHHCGPAPSRWLMANDPDGSPPSAASRPQPHHEKSPHAHETTSAEPTVFSVGDGPHPTIRQTLGSTPQNVPDHDQSAGSHPPPATDPKPRSVPLP